MPAYQIPYGEHVFKLWGHGMVLHGHEQRVQHNADGDGQVNKWIHDNQVHYLLQLHPVRVAFPDQERVGKLVPARGTLPLGLFQLYSYKTERQQGSTFTSEAAGSLGHADLVSILDEELCLTRDPAREKG